MHSPLNPSRTHATHAANNQREVRDDRLCDRTLRPKVLTLPISHHERAESRRGAVMSRLSASGPHRSSLWRRLRPRDNAAALLRGARACLALLAATGLLALAAPAQAQTLTAPGAPTGLAATANGQSRIDLAWTAPTDNGGAAITGYRIEVSPDGASTSWSDLVADTQSTATTYPHMGLNAATTRHYRVSAINAVGTSDPSGSDDATTNAATNNVPVFSSSNVSRSIAENTAAGQDIGAVVTATDADNDTLTYTLGGDDMASFDFVGSTGQIRTKSGVSYDHEAKSSHAVTVTVSDGTATAVANVTISVTDVDEPPSAPATPAVSAVSGSSTSLSVSWAAPANAGKPDIASYDVQYRAGSSGTWSDGPEDVTGTTTTTTIIGLTADTLYEARVRATNAEGDSGWSDPPGSGRTPALGEAQTGVLVSNTGQLNSGHRVVGADEYAQPFDTGNNSDGYSLTGIVLDLQAAPTGSGTLTITVREDSSGSPVRAALYTLANPALAAGLNEFLAPENAELHANTTYWVVATYSADTGGPAWYRTVQTYGLDAGAAAGWAIDAPYKIDGRVAQDGWVVHSLPRTLQIAVKGTAIGGANTPPTAADNTVATAVDTPYTFTADDFGFTDTDFANMLASVRIVTVPAAGTLALDGTVVLADAVVTKAQIDGDMLTFTPVAGASGAPYTTFTFKVNDGTDDSANAYTMTIDVAVLPAITIAADRDKATGKLDWIHYTLSREGDTAAELTVTVILAGPAGNDWGLDTTKTSQEVTFAAGSAMAEQSIRLTGDGPGQIGFSLSATTSGALTARLGATTGYDTSDTDEVEVVVTSGPAWVIKLAEDHYRFDEDGGDQDIELVATAASADMPAPSLDPSDNSVLFVSIITQQGTAEAHAEDNPGDFLAFSATPYFTSSTCSADPNAGNVQVCRSNVTFTPVDDAEAEPDETLELALSGGLGAPSIHFQGPGPDRTVSGLAKTYPATIVDDEFGVTGVTVTSTPRLAMDTYGAREHIELSVSFNKPVTVTGAPTFTFDLGGTTTTAAYQGGSGTRTLVFSHQVMPDNSDTNGIAWAANALALAGGTIVEMGGSAAPTLTVAVQSALSDHKVNGALTAPPAITIAADRPTATGKLDWIHYTLNREGDTAAELTVTVILAGPAGNDWSLDTTKTSQEVTFAADSATATQIIRVIGSGFGHIGFSESAAMSGTLTARLGAKTGYDTSDTDEVAVVVTSGPAWVIKLADSWGSRTTTASTRTAATRTSSWWRRPPPPTCRRRRGIQQTTGPFSVPPSLPKPARRTLRGTMQPSQQPAYSRPRRAAPTPTPATCRSAG